MKFLLETHCHTKETSWCAHVPAANAIENYKAAGYGGVVITDHFHKHWFDGMGKSGWKDKLEKWLKGYRAAEKAGKRLDISIYFGMEFTVYGEVNDYLLYGAEPDLIYAHPEILDFNCKQIYRFAEEHGLFFAQAHAFRPGMTPADPAFLHGLEVYNGNPRHKNQNELALEYAKAHGLVQLSGSDYHQLEDIATGGVYLPEKPASSGELADLFRNNQISALVRGK